MIATIVNDQWIYMEHITDSEENALWEAFSVARPGTYIDPMQMGNWDGIYRKYNRGQHRLARPLLSMLRGVCKKANLPLTIQDKRPAWEYAPLPIDQINNDFLPKITLEQYQVDCIRKATQVETGVIDVPTGGGKGELIAGLVKAIPCPTIILADQRIVVKQLKERIELRDVADVGMFYAGARPNGETVVVGSIQSLSPPTKPPELPVRTAQETDKEFQARMAKWDIKYKSFKTRKANSKELLQYARNAEMVIVDECDKATSDPWKNFFRHYFKGRRRYGFSGTPEDPDKPVEAMVMKEHLGSVIFRETRKHLTDLGRIIPCEYFMLNYAPSGSINEASAYDIAYNEHMTESVLFHETVARLCKRCKKQEGDGTLVLVDREGMGYRLEEAITAIGLKVKFIFGNTPQKQRDAALKAFEARELDVLIGSKIINRGMDLKGGCENLILACGGKMQSDFIQKIGRALRVNKRGRSKIYDFFFRCNRYLYDHSKARLKTMIKAGYPTTVVFPGGGISGAELVKSRFQVKRKLLQPKSKVPSPAKS